VSESGQPLVSVIIPAYNAEPFLREAIESVLAQSYEPIEVIVVDDGSTDGTSAVAASFGGAVTMVGKENGGVSSARNAGLEHASGEFVCFLDADDWFYPDNIAQKVSYLQSHPDRGWVFARVEITDEALDPTGQLMEGTAESDALGPLLELIPPAVPCPSNVLLRTAVVREEGAFDESLGTCADFDMWLRVAARHGVGRVDETLVKYRRHEGAMFSNVEAQVRDMERIFAKHGPAFSQRPEWSLLAKRFYRSIAGEYKRRGQYMKVMRTLVRAALRSPR